MGTMLRSLIVVHRPCAAAGHCSGAETLGGEVPGSAFSPAARTHFMNTSNGTAPLKSLSLRIPVQCRHGCAGATLITYNISRFHVIPCACAPTHESPARQFSCEAEPPFSTDKSRLAAATREKSLPLLSERIRLPFLAAAGQQICADVRRHAHLHHHVGRLER